MTYRPGRRVSSENAGMISLIAFRHVRSGSLAVHLGAFPRCSDCDLEGIAAEGCKKSSNRSNRQARGDLAVWPQQSLKPDLMVSLTVLKQALTRTRRYGYFRKGINLAI